MTIVKVNDIEMYYEIHGEGVPLIVIPGLFGSSESGYARIFMEEFSNKYKVILLDNRGTGRSDKPDIEYSIMMMADDISGLMDAILIPKAHVLGASMGGAIAQALALNHPNKVLSLILCCTCCGSQRLYGSSPNPMTKEFWDFVESIARGQPPEMSVEEYSEFYLRTALSPKYVQENRDSLLRSLASIKYPTPLVGRVRQAQAALNFDFCERLSEIKVPTIVMAAEDDVLVSPENSRFLAERISDARLKMFNEGAHNFIPELQDQVIPLILDFLDEVDA
jgi:pimeloyl-ACP methyl ester carboxylesterase